MRRINALAAKTPGAKPLSRAASPDDGQLDTLARSILDNARTPLRTPAAHAGLGSLTVHADQANDAGMSLTLPGGSRTMF